MPVARSPIGAATFGRSPSRETCIGTSRSLLRPPKRASRAAALRDSPPSRPMAAMCARSRLTVTPPFRPAFRASSDDHSCAVPFSWAARPPLLAISRCRMGSIDANPRRLFPVIRPPASGLPKMRRQAGTRRRASVTEPAHRGELACHPVQTSGRSFRFDGATPGSAAAKRNRPRPPGRW